MVSPYGRCRGKGLEISLYIALLNPSIALVLAAAFVTIWFYQRPQRYLIVLALGYSAIAGGFLLQYFSLPLGVTATRLLSNLLFLGGAMLVSGGVVAKYERSVPFAAFAALGGLGFAAFSWFMFIQPDLTWRILSINFALGGIALVVAGELRAVPNRNLIDNILLAVSLLAGLNFLVRTLILVGLHGPYENYEGFQQSTYWTTVMLSHALLSIVMALCLIASSVLRLVEELRLLSQSDPLSGLLNRRGFEEQATNVLQRTGFGAPSALVLCDLDHFKVVNDTYGHDCGDRVIAAFANHLRLMAGQKDVLGRMGGEEFAILLPRTGLPAARLFAEGVRVSFGDALVAGLPEQIRVTASFGIAIQNRAETLSAMLRRADEALYQAKRGGRDRVATLAGEHRIDAA